MFDGKMLRGLPGTPRRSRLRAKSSFADAEPEPLTLANLTTKSFTASIRGALPALTLLVALPVMFVVISGRPLRPAAAAAAGAGLRDHELLHVPGAGRAALGAQAAVQADVLVLDHHAARLELARDVEVLRQIEGRRLQPRTQAGFVPRRRERDAVHRADVHGGVALDAGVAVEDRLHVAVQAAAGLLE